MTRLTTALICSALLTVAADASAQDHSFVQGFGSFSFGNGSFFTSNSTSFGGVVGTRLTPNMQVVGEAGRIGNVVPPVADLLLDFTSLDYGISAWYAQGGIRFTTSGRSGIRPYAETSAGFARLSTNLSGFGSTTADVLADFGLQFLNRTDPIASAGGGVTFEHGHFLGDIGYRYRRIFSPEWVNVLAFGDSLHSNDLRFGLGIKF